jgi:hypothetical protein
VAAAALALAVLSSGRVASADSGLAAALDVDLAFPVENEFFDSGRGAALRVGYQIGLVVLDVTPEIGGSFHSFGGAANPSLYRAFAGARISVGEIIQPGVFAHTGWARLTVEGDQVALQSDRNATSYDFGGFVDFTLIPDIDLGVHGAYAYMEGTEAGPRLNYLIFGLHAAYVF